MEKNLNIKNSSFSKHILSVPCRAVIKGQGPGFPPATMNVAPGYFHWKIEEKYSQLSLRQTPLGPALSVCLIESQIKGVKKDRDQL